MLHEHEFICPICGLVIPSLTAFHQHHAKVHQKKEPTQ